MLQLGVALLKHNLIKIRHCLTEFMKMYMELLFPGKMCSPGQGKAPGRISGDEFPQKLKYF